MSSSIANGNLRDGGEPNFNSEHSQRVRALSVLHDDLDAVIAALLRASNCDDLLVTRLKKRKLQIKDEIALAMPAMQSARTA